VTVAIRSIADLPFVERDAHELLALDRDEPDPDYAGYGWARVREIWLESALGAHPVADAVVVAIHSADDAEPVVGDIELEFEVPGGAVSVLLSAFLDRWLPRLPPDGPVVLAVCNDHGAAIPHRDGRLLWYPVGPVEAWLDVDTGRIRLVADRWEEAG
jgi:hypothetical protein